MSKKHLTLITLTTGTALVFAKIELKEYSVYSEETMSSSVDVENWSGRWWFPEQTWSFDEAIDLTFEPKDIKLIGSIVK